VEKPAPSRLSSLVCSSAHRAGTAHELHLMLYTICDRVISRRAQSSISFAAAP